VGVGDGSGVGVALLAGVFVGGTVGVGSKVGDGVWVGVVALTVARTVALTVALASVGLLVDVEVGVVVDGAPVIGVEVGADWLIDTVEELAHAAVNMEINPTMINSLK
jgi:hypothetical protein